MDSLKLIGSLLSFAIYIFIRSKQAFILKLSLHYTYYEIEREAFLERSDHHLHNNNISVTHII